MDQVQSGSDIPVTLARSNALINKALVSAQGNFRTPTLNRTAKVMKEGRLLYETHYADLQECIDCVKPSLSANGLAFTQTIDFDPKIEFWLLVLTLRHESGEELRSVMPLNLNQPPQQVGGALTYFKRYQIAAFFGLAADFDDDGNATAKAPDHVQFEKKTTAAPNKDVTKPNPTSAPAEKKLHNYAPGAENPNPSPHPDVELQSFPPDDVPAKKKNDDPGEYEIPIEVPKCAGAMGTKVNMMSERQLKAIIWNIDKELKVKGPPNKNTSTYIEIKRMVEAFLKSVGAR